MPLPSESLADCMAVSVLISLSGSAAMTKITAHMAAGS